MQNFNQAMVSSLDTALKDLNSLKKLLEPSGVSPRNVWTTKKIGEIRSVYTKYLDTLDRVYDEVGTLATDESTSEDDGSSACSDQNLRESEGDSQSNNKLEPQMDEKSCADPKEKSEAQPVQDNPECDIGDRGDFEINS